MPISGVVARGGGIGAAAEFKSELVSVVPSSSSW